jgi:hypothetical protein
MSNPAPPPPPTGGDAADLEEFRFVPPAGARRPAAAAGAVFNDNELAYIAAMRRVPPPPYTRPATVASAREAGIFLLRLMALPLARAARVTGKTAFIRFLSKLKMAPLTAALIRSWNVLIGAADVYTMIRLVRPHLSPPSSLSCAASVPSRTPPLTNAPSCPQAERPASHPAVAPYLNMKYHAYKLAPYQVDSSNAAAAPPPPAEPPNSPNADDCVSPA